MLGWDAPIDLDRAEAARQAAAELADPAYRAARPSWLERLVAWLLDQLTDLISRASAAAPGGWWGILGLAVVIAVTIIVIRWRVGPIARNQALELSLDPSVPASQYRARAAASALAGDWGEAVTLRMSAIVRAAEERGLVPARPGRTVDEFAQAVGQVAPQAATSVMRAATVFDRVRYGSRAADQGDYAAIVAADDDLAAAPRVSSEVTA
jgi:hypothetical protein